MNLLFAPDDGLFEGEAFPPLPAKEAVRGAMADHVKLVAERVYVADGLAAPNVPVTVLHRSVGRAIDRANAARVRAGLSPLVAPSRPTVSRWMLEFEARHHGRAGLGKQWRGYEGPASPSRDCEGGTPRAK